MQRTVDFRYFFRRGSYADTSFRKGMKEDTSTVSFLGRSRQLTLSLIFESFGLEYGWIQVITLVLHTPVPYLPYLGIETVRAAICSLL